MIVCCLPEILQFVLIFALRFENSSFPKPLSVKQEKKYFEKLNTSKHAFEMLVKHNLRLVAHIVKKYYVSINDQDDLISIGAIGLIKAVKGFDYRKKIKFATFASRCIENEILMYFRQLKKTSNDVYIGDENCKDENSNSLFYSNMLISDDDVEKIVELNINKQKVYHLIQTNLSERERKVIIYRYGLFKHIPLTQKETAKKLLISRSYVSRIEKKALQILKSEFKN